LLWNDLDDLIGAAVAAAAAVSSVLGELRTEADGRALAAAEIVMAVADDGSWGRLRRDDDEGMPVKPVDGSRFVVDWVVAEGGGAGMPDMLCLRADMGASRCARCEADVDPVAWSDWRTLGVVWLKSLRVTPSTAS